MELLRNRGWQPISQWWRLLLSKIGAAAAIGVLVFFVASVPVQAQSLDVDGAGYAKHLTIRGASPLSEEPFWINTSRLRLQAFVDGGTWFRSEAAFDTEVLLGSYASSADYALARELERPTYVNLDWGLWNGEYHDIRQGFHRLHATGEFDAFRVRLGRQRIAWGSGFFWNPTDLLNPVNPAAVERDEEPGVDAAHLVVPFGVLNRAEAAFAPGWDDTPVSIASRVQANVNGYDVAVMGGSFRGDAVVGGEFAGYVGGAGFRGEAAYTWREDQSNFIRAILNADHTLAGGTHLLAEFYLNGRGAVSPDDYESEQLLEGDAFNLGRYYLAGMASHSISPLVQGSFYTLFNLGDQSALAGPMLQYSLTQDVDVVGGAYLMVGGERSEFGGRDNVYFASLQYFF